MKVKILLVPFIITVSLGLAIWLVYPAYSNGSSGVKEKYNQLKNEEKKLAEMKEKNSNVEKLFSEISSISLEKEILYKFIPEDMAEDEVVNDVGQIASESDIMINEISIKSLSSETKNPLELEKKIASLPSSKESKITVKLMGKYEKIKEFLEKIYKSDRYSNLKSLQISNDLREKENSNSSVLLVNVEIDFSTLEKTKILDGNINDEVFSSSSLDTGIIELIKKQKNVNNNRINIDRKGKENLFIP